MACVILQKVNPFNYINPIRKEERFIGRKSELKTIDYILDLAESGSQYQNIAIIGDRAIGKTSLKNILLLRAQKRNILAVSIDLDEELVSDSAKFFGTTIQAILSEGTERLNLFEEEQKKGLLNKFTHAFLAKAQEGKIPHIFDADLVQNLNLIKDKANKKNVNCILIAIDEANLLSLNRSILQRIRNVFQKLEGFILVLLGTESLLEDLSNVFSPIQRFFVRVNLKPFSKDEIKEGIQKPLQSVGSKIKVDPHILDDVEKVSGGYPYEVNLIAHFAFKIATEQELKTLMLTKDVFEEIKNQKEQLLGFEKMFSALSEVEQEILKTIVFVNGEMSTIEFARLNHDFEGAKITDSATIRTCTQIHRPVFKRLEKKGLLTLIRTEGKKKIYTLKDKWLELYVKYTKVIPEAFEEYPRRHYHMLERPSFHILDKMMEWLQEKMEKQILVTFVTTRRKDEEGWSACCARKEESPIADKIANYLWKTTKKLFKEKNIDNALPRFDDFLHKSLPRKIKPEKLEVLSKTIIDKYEIRVAFLIVKSQGKSKVQKVFEQAMNYVNRFWTFGRVSIY